MKNWPVSDWSHTWHLSSFNANAFWGNLSGSQFNPWVFACQLPTLKNMHQGQERGKLVKCEMSLELGIIGWLCGNCGKYTREENLQQAKRARGRLGVKGSSSKCEQTKRNEGNIGKKRERRTDWKIKKNILLPHIKKVYLSDDIVDPWGFGMLTGGKKDKRLFCKTQEHLFSCVIDSHLRWRFYIHREVKICHRQYLVTVL